MTVGSVANLVRVLAVTMGLLSIAFSMLSLRYFLRREPPIQIRQHVQRVTLTYVSFVMVGTGDNVTHWGQPFRWQLFGYVIVYLLAINAQAPLLAYEGRAAKFGTPPAAPELRVVPRYQTTLSSTATLVVIAVVTVWLGAALLPEQLSSPAFDPLVLSKQTVTNRVEGVAGPALHLGDELQVNAVKCNTSGKDIGIAGHTRWVSVEPGGTTIDGTVGSGIRPAAPRCPEFHFSNKIPDGVVARTQELFDQGRTSVSWTYTGVETPLGLRGVSRAWSTEVFEIVK